MSGALPAGACDAHCHVFGPAARFPFDPARSYTPADASREDLFALHDRLGLDRAVIVQPAAHGLDMSATLDAIAARPDRYRGVALLAEDAREADVEALHRGGVRSVRFNFMSRLSQPPTRDVFRRTAALIAPLGWHLTVHVTPGDVDLLEDYLEDLPVPFVIDHMARIAAGAGLQQPAFAWLLDRLRRPNAWVKISAADRMSAAGAPYDDALPFMAKLVEAAPGRVLWGTDWPHPNITGPIPNESVLISLLRRAAGDAGTLRKILVDNPARLFGFGPAPPDAAAAKPAG